LFALLKKKTIHNQLFTGTLWSAVCAAGVLFVLILEFSERKMSHFLDDVHFIESLNEPVDNSGSEEMYQKRNIAHPSQIPIQVCDHIVLE